MVMDAPRQDWEAYRRLAAASDAAWVRGLSPSERFDLYADLFDIIWKAPRDPAQWERLERARWDAKLAIRLRLVDAFMRMDEIARERAAADYSD
jgi:hypothetical protein